MVRSKSGPHLSYQGAFCCKGLGCDNRFDLSCHIWGLIYAFFEILYRYHSSNVVSSGSPWNTWWDGATWTARDSSKFTIITICIIVVEKVNCLGVYACVWCGVAILTYCAIYTNRPYLIHKNGACMQSQIALLTAPNYTGAMLHFSCFCRDTFNLVLFINWDFLEDEKANLTILERENSNDQTILCE